MKEAGAVIRQPETLMRWLRSYAATVASTTAWGKVRDGASAGESEKPDKKTSSRYTETPFRLRILDEVHRRGCQVTTTCPGSVSPPSGSWRTLHWLPGSWAFPVTGC